MRFIIGVLWMISMIACSSKRNVHLNPKMVVQTDTIKVKSPKMEIAEIPNFEDKIQLGLDTSSVLQSGFTGLEIFDLQAEKVIFSHQADKYFVAASNVKIFTLYTCVKTIQDSLTALRYVDTDSTFTFWGQADPTFLHPYFADSRVLDFLKSKAATKKMILANDHALSHYGKGWMWDDFNDYYQPEITAFPMYGNILWVNKDSTGLHIQPIFMTRDTSQLQDLEFIKRDFDKNHFQFPNLSNYEEGFLQEIPYKDAAKLNAMMLELILQKTVHVQNLPTPSNSLKFKSFPVDTVFSRMMEVSDNMLAEHLLLASGMETLDTLSTEMAINQAKSNLLHGSPHQLIWVDGSGLSRYNRFTPASLIFLLKKMYAEIPESRLFSLMVEGGNGTLGSLYNNDSIPFIYAKTGSMTGVYNLSGYLITNKGKKLAFSFMNNNFSGRVSTIKKEVEKILMEIRNTY